MMNRRAIIVAALICVAMQPGCETASRGPAAIPPQNATRASGPSFSEIALPHNTRAAQLRRLWTRASIRVEAEDREGNRDAETVEGYLQIIQPRRVALTVNKLGETYYYLGSNEERYWWIDLTNKDKKFALVGRHSRATPERAREFGVPLHPLDLLDLLGVSQIMANPKITTRWGADRKEAIIVVPPRADGWGRREFAFNPATKLPVRVEVYGADGKLAARAQLDEYKPMSAREGVATPLVPTRIDISIPASKAEIRLRLDEPDNRPIRAVPFDLPGLLERFGIPQDRVGDLDLPKKPTGAVPAGSPRAP